MFSTVLLNSSPANAMSSSRSSASSRLPPTAPPSPLTSVDAEHRLIERRRGRRGRRRAVAAVVAVGPGSGVATPPATGVGVGRGRDRWARRRARGARSHGLGSVMARASRTVQRTSTGPASRSGLRSASGLAWASVSGSAAGVGGGGVGGNEDRLDNPGAARGEHVLDHLSIELAVADGSRSARPRSSSSLADLIDVAVDTRGVSARERSAWPSSSFRVAAARPVGGIVAFVAARVRRLVSWPDAGLIDRGPGCPLGSCT